MVRVNDNCDRQPTDIWKSDRLLIHHLITSYRTLRREDRSVMERDMWHCGISRSELCRIYSSWIMSESSWKPWNCCFHRQRLLGNLEDSAILLYNFIPRYGRMIVERAAVRSETKRIAIYPSCRDLSICQNMPEISAPRPQMDFIICFFLDEKHMSSRLPGDGAKFSEAAEISRSGVEERQ